MTKSLWGLTIVAAVSACLTIWAEYYGPAWLLYTCKPLTMLAIISIVFTGNVNQSSNYRNAILVGLVFSMAGDILLMLPIDMFKAGLVSFLIAHLIYIAGFMSGRPRQQRWLTLIPWGIYGILIYLVLAPYLGVLKIPVGIYVIVILVMGWQARERWLFFRDKATIIALAGAIFFIISDSFHALHRFREPFATGRLLTLSTYFTAQWLLAISTTKK